MNKIAEIMKRERCSFTQAQKLAGLETCLVTKNRAPKPGSVSQLEEGLMLYEKWKQGPFTDTDGTDRLDCWVWEHMDQLFRLVELMVESEKARWLNEQAAAMANDQSPESPDTL